MWFKATTVQRRHLFLSSTISLRKARLQWPPQTRDFEAERAALGKVLHQEVMFQDAPEVTWKRGSVKQPKASLQRRPGHQESLSSTSSSGGQAGAAGQNSPEKGRSSKATIEANLVRLKSRDLGVARTVGDVSPEEG